MTKAEYEEAAAALFAARSDGEMDQMEFSQARQQLNWDFDHGVALKDSFVAEYLSSPSNQT